MWSLREFLPKFEQEITLFEGGTPLFPLKNFDLLPNLHVKCEFRNPTGSFRDRACSLIMSDMRSRHITNIINASTGSFSISLAAYAAKAQTKATVIVPENIELAKIEQMQLYGAQVIQKGISLEEAMNYADTLIPKKNYYLPHPKENLLTIEGQKTIGLEIALQKEKIENIIIPRGSGTMIVSVYQGLLDALESGWITSLPRIFAISLENARDAHLAESLEGLQTPILLENVDRIIKDTGGKSIEIKAQQMIEDAMKLAKLEGIFIEPASASVISAAKHLFTENELKKGDTIAILSGTGLNAMNVFASRLRGMDKVVWGISKRSTARFEILELIGTQKANYAPGILESLSNPNSIQSIYQHLANMEEEGLIFDEQPEKKRKNYKITVKGKKLLESMKDIIDLQSID
jgi:threonine synthase